LHIMVESLGKSQLWKRTKRSVCFPDWDTQGVQSFEISVSCLGPIRNVMLAGWMPGVRGESRPFINQPINGYDGR
jgi:hypothetical protein